MPKARPVNVGLIGAGRIGSFHGETVVHRLVDADLVAIADPAPGAAGKLAETLGVDAAYTDAAELLAHPGLDAVIIASPARFHTNLLVQAAEAGKAIFCEKPMALTLEDAERGIVAARQAGVQLQAGFNRRWDQSFAEGHAAIRAGKVGTPQLLRSVIRDPGPFGADPAKIPLWTIFYETLIHDFDTLLWLNAGARPVEVYAVGDALVRPDARDAGFLDTAVVTIRFDNGSIAAEANFCAMYGYDIRGEVFGSGGMVTMGDVRRSSMTLFDKDGVSQDTWRRDTDHFLHGYTAQLAAFVRAVQAGTPVDGPTGEDARGALSIALACIESIKVRAPVAVR